MRWVKDRSGRFGERPFYEAEELDELCETLMTNFLRRRHGSVVLPIDTNDLTVLLEEFVEDLDLYVDFEGDEADAEGLTNFVPGRRPSVRVARELSEQTWRENRLRTTLTHELGHVVIHGPLYDRRQQSPLPLFELPVASSPRCKRASQPVVLQGDWLEWQAGYASGAFLMPAEALTTLVLALVEECDALCPVPTGSRVGDTMVARTARAFKVSEAAARVRLCQKGYLADSWTLDPLFR